MEELKRIVADNLIRLRQEAGMTQVELGEKLNYSDKTVSKWERAESLPDAFVLKRIATIFGVSVDMLLSPYEDGMKALKNREMSFSSNMVILDVIVGIWTLALFVFVLLWTLGNTIFPLVFAIAVPVSLVALLVMRSIWNQGRYNYWIVSALVLSLFLLVYFCFWRSQPWQILLMIFPAEAIVYLSFRIKQH